MIGVSILIVAIFLKEDQALTEDRGSIEEVKIDKIIYRSIECSFLYSFIFFKNCICLSVIDEANGAPGRNRTCAQGLGILCSIH